MKSKLLITIMLTILCSTILIAQNDLAIKPFGVSPAMIKADTLGNPNFLGILDRQATGLANAGVETKVYLQGMRNGAMLTSAMWEITQAPDGSAAAIGVVVDQDTSSQITSFVPDVVGTYIVTFSDAADAADIVINAAKFTGIEDGKCASCHSGKAEEWAMTGHSTFLKRGLEGLNGSYYNAGCISCHTVGFDDMAANDGFDDFDFEFPAVKEAGVWDSLLVKYPDAMKRANIQCENCHGPGGSHFGNTADAKMVSSWSADACAKCHDDDHYHVYPSQWKTAAHANITAYPGGTRTSCRGCHNGAQFAQYVAGEPITVETEHIDITCAVCHDPHNVDNEYQLRTLKATLSNGEMVPAKAGKGALCMNCHQSRREANSYTDKAAGHYGPHYAPQADMLIGTNAVTFGKKLPTSPHLSALDDACVDCHMHEKGNHGEHDDDGNLNTAGMHSFSMVDINGVDNVVACSGCHGDVGESFDHKKFYMNGMADHDGDGDDEGLQEEVHGLVDKLAMMLPSADVHQDPDSTWTLTELKASFNHRLIYYDHSYGIHNPAYIVSLLKVSIQALVNNAIDGDIVAIDDVPNDQGKTVRIIWDKMADDGVAIDPVEQYIVKRHDMDKDVWVGVGQHPADGSMRYAVTVPTVYDSTANGMGMTTFKVVALTQGGTAHESMPAEGYSVDNLIPMAPANVVAQVVGASDVILTWDEAVDKDFNYFAIYRSTEAGFESSEELLVATTTGVEIIDAALELDGTYYYKVYAYDFSGNQSEASDEVSAQIATGVESDGPAVPTEFSLNQNYPNPFNPSTTIKFGVPMAGIVKISVYDIRGVRVRTLATGQFAAGYHTVTWNGFNDAGVQVANGTYMYRLETDAQVFTKKMVFLK
jgi:hypothetical protein